MRAPGGLRGARPLCGRETRRQRKPCHNGRRPIPAKIRGFRERFQNRAHHGRPRRVRCRLRCPHVRCSEDDRLRHPAHVRHVRRNHSWCLRSRGSRFRPRCCSPVLGTLLFHFLAKGKVPAFLGSSFAFIAGYAAIAPNGEAHLLPYACLGVACAGLLYLVVSALFKAFGPAAHHAVLSAGGHGPHRHLHRAYSGKLGHCQLRDELAYRARGHHHYRHQQHLGHAA